MEASPGSSLRVEPTTFHAVWVSLPLRLSILKMPQFETKYVTL